LNCSEKQSDSNEWNKLLSTKSGIISQYPPWITAS